jgi:hypothetical protein
MVHPDDVADAARLQAMVHHLESNGIGPCTFSHSMPCQDRTIPIQQQSGGAFANCWIDHATLSQAEAAARKCIQDAGWKIRTLDDTRIVERSDYDEAPESLKYYEQAETDKEAFVLLTYPIDDAN